MSFTSIVVSLAVIIKLYILIKNRGKRYADDILLFLEDMTRFRILDLFGKKIHQFWGFLLLWMSWQES